MFKYLPALHYCINALCAFEYCNFEINLFLFQNIFISLMCFLFLIILALLQFRVIQDSYLLVLCYGILLAATTLCVMSMPALNKIIPIDTREVIWLNSTWIYWICNVLFCLISGAGLNWRRLASDFCRIRYICSNAITNLGGHGIRRSVAHDSHGLINISNVNRNTSLLWLQPALGKFYNIHRC